MERVSLVTEVVVTSAAAAACCCCTVVPPCASRFRCAVFRPPPPPSHPSPLSPLSCFPCGASPFVKLLPLQLTAAAVVLCLVLVRLLLRTVLHHLLEEFDDDLGGRPHEHLALATLLGVEDRPQAVIEHGNADHGNRLQSRKGAIEGARR